MTTALSQQQMIPVVGWYDNEWGYASRVAGQLHQRVRAQGTSSGACASGRARALCATSFTPEGLLL